MKMSLHDRIWMIEENVSKLTEDNLALSQERDEYFNMLKRLLKFVPPHLYNDIMNLLNKYNEPETNSIGNTPECSS